MHHKQCLIADSARFLVQIEPDILPAKPFSFPQRQSWPLSEEGGEDWKNIRENKRVRGSLTRIAHAMPTEGFVSHIISQAKRKRSCALLELPKALGRVVHVYRGVSLDHR